MQPPAPLVVGFDLDMTLIDTRPGFAATLAVLAAETGVEIDVEEISGRLGPPLDLLLAPHYPGDQLPGLVDRFRAHYPDHAIEPTPAFPGAHEALAAVRRHGGRSVIVTGKYRPNAALHLDALGLDADELVGEVWGAGKGPALTEHGATVYVGDHVHDVEGAHAAGAVSVSVLTGGCTEQELLDAGTDVVLRDLTELPGWLDAHLLDDAARRCWRSGSVPSGRCSSPTAGVRTARSCWLRRSGRSAPSTSAPRRRTPTRSRRASARRPWRSPRHSGCGCSRPETHEMEREGYRANAGDRCYFCKAELLDVLGPLAEAHGFAAVATGTNADDAVAGFRPGIRAAAERGAVTPLRDAGLTKAQVRAASRAWDLPTWDKPAAACLSSRVAFGIEVSPFRLARVERAEAAARAALAAAGIDVRDLRVRDTGDRASLEVDAALVVEVAATPAVLAARPGRGVHRCRGRSAGFPVGLDERAAGRARAFQVTPWKWGTAPP